jgi:hypothetical protein
MTQPSRKANPAGGLRLVRADLHESRTNTNGRWLGDERRGVESCNPSTVKAESVNSSRLPKTWFLLVVLSFWLLVVPAANAYVDPGTGSYIFQVVIGVFLGAAVAVKVFWRRIWGFFTRKPAGSTSARMTDRHKED